MHLPHRAWLLLSGVVTLLLGVYIWRQLPGAAVWVIGTLVGIDMIFIVWFVGDAGNGREEPVGFGTRRGVSGGLLG